MLVFMQEPSIWPVQSYAEITLEKCICVGRTIVNTVPTSDKKISCKHECLGEVMVAIDPFCLDA